MENRRRLALAASLAVHAAVLGAVAFLPHHRGGGAREPEIVVRFSATLLVEPETEDAPPEPAPSPEEPALPPARTADVTPPHPPLVVVERALVAVPLPRAAPAPPRRRAAPVAPAAPGSPVGQSSAAVCTHRATPDYPSAAERARRTGRAVVLLSLDAAGRIIAARVASSSGHADLDAAALAAARRCRFRPAQRGSLGVASEVRVPYTFALD